MDDLRRRFASLDRLPVPDLWTEIEDRSIAGVAATPRIPTARVSSPVGVAWRSPRVRPQALLVAGLVAVLGLSAIAVGSGLVRVPTIQPPPSPTPLVATPAPSITALPSPTAVSPPGLVAYDVVEPIDPAPEGCTPPSHPWCVQERLWVVQTDGSSARRLLPDVPGTQSFVAWHPDGTRLLYRDDGGGLVLRDVTGSSARTFALSRLCPVDNCPYLDGIALSPDGSRIVYVLSDSGIEDTTVLAVFDLVTERLSVLESTRVNGVGCMTEANEGHNDAPVWSPDGTTIAFVRQGLGLRAEDGSCQGRLLLVDADGQNLREILPHDVRPLRPQWSPDGSTILFHDSVFPGERTETANLHTVRPDGTGLRQLTDDGASAWARWSSDGRIIFVRWTSADRDRYEVWRMDADGTGATRLDPSISALSSAGCVVCPDAREPTSGAELYWQPVP